MISIDTNILLYAQNSDCREHRAAWAFLTRESSNRDVAVCELVLVELYVLLRTSAVIERPLSAAAAAGVCQAYRRHPRWRLIDTAPVMDEVWRMAAETGLARRRIFDVRLALTLRHHGVNEVATANVADFEGLGFERVFNPCAS